jgi:hypothetical protein
MNPNNLQSPQSSENLENISEMFYLLNFFSKSPREQWSIMPENFVPVWVETYHFHCNIYSSILFLACMLAESIDEGFFVNTYMCTYNRQNFDRNIVSILEDEIYPLLVEWIFKAYSYNNDSIFEKEEEITEPSKIWLVLSRLCQIALSFEDWSKYEINELSFEHFVEKHSYPYDPV